MKRLIPEALALSLAVAAAAAAAQPARPASAERPDGVRGAARGQVAATPAQLMQALQSAKGGEVLRLRPGRYPNMELADLHFAQPVTITSDDPRRPATLVGMKMGDSSGVRFANLEFATTGADDAYYAFRVANSDHIAFDNLEVHGDRNAEPASQLTGFYVSNSSNIEIVKSRFDHLNSAMVTNNNTDITISENRFSYVSKGGVEMGGCSMVVIKDNLFTDFHISRSTHSDAIQIYTAGIKAPAHDLFISGNLFLRGQGEAAQGIFIQDEVGALPFSNVHVVDNAIIGGMWHSIYVKHATGPVEIRDNVVATWPGLDPGKARATDPASAPLPVTPFIAWIFVGGDLRGARISEVGNASQQYRSSLEGSLPPPPGNQVEGDVRDGGRALAQAWASRRQRPLPADWS